MKMMKLAGLAVTATSLAGCTTADLEAFSEAMASVPYQSPYGYNTPFQSYGKGMGNWVGYNQCRHSGTFYLCDTNGDGLADSFGDAGDGSYTSSHLKVNGKGEGFTRGENGEWVRNRAYDTSDRDDHHHHHRYD